MSEDTYIEHCKACLAASTVTYSHAETALKQYGQTIVSIGYVGFLALWSQLWGEIGNIWLLLSGVLILISGSIFVGLEVYMIRFNVKAIAKKKVLLSELARAVQDDQRDEVNSCLRKLYPENEVDKSEDSMGLANISIFTGFGAALTLIIGIGCVLV